MSSSSDSEKSEAPPSKVVIEVAARNPKQDPIVASFPGGFPFTEDDEEGVRFVWRKLEPRSKHGRSLMGRDSTCIYQAESVPGETRLTKTCVGLYNKRTGKLTLHQTAEEGAVFSLTQIVRNYKEELPSLSRGERRKALFEAFGSSKKQKVLKSQAANVVNVKSVVGSGSLMRNAFMARQSESSRREMEQKASGIKVDAVGLAYEEARRKFLPPFDKDANEPHKVYSERDIAGDAAWGQVTRVTDACLAKEGSFVANLTSRGRWFESVQGILSKIPPDGANAKNQIKCAILMNHMMHFANRTGRNRLLRGNAMEISEMMKFPIEIGARFLDLFTTPTTGERGEQGFACSKQTSDKCLVHIFLLNLMAHGHEMKAENLVQVARDVKIEVSDAVNLMRAAGCTVKSAGRDIWKAQLFVPLTFPPPKRGRGAAS
jgi:hypothetical protein